MSNTCPDCGAISQGENTCQSIFDAFLVLEFTDPTYGAVHFLTVSCYWIQHGRYSDEALVWIAQKLQAYLDEGISTGQMRRQDAQEIAQDKRIWKVTRRPSEPPQAKIAWSKTIVNVASKYRDAESYRDLVKQWARATLQEMKPLL